MIKKIAIVDNCKECPFFVDNEWDVVKDSRCKKSELKGSAENLYKYGCPLPDYEEEIVYESVDELIYGLESDEKSLKKKNGFWSWNE